MQQNGVEFKKSDDHDDDNRVKQEELLDLTSG